MSKNQNNEEVLELTKEALDELKAELETRKVDERKKIADEIAAARELGDLRENHPYTVAMEKKSMNENRISELEDMIKKAVVVKSSASSKVVTIGKKVEILNKDSKTKRVVQLVGTEDAQSSDPREGKISIDSPIGKALINSRIGDEVTAKLPSGNVLYKIEKFID